MIHFVLKYGSHETVEYFCKFSAYFAIDLNVLDPGDYTPLLRCIFIRKDHTLAARLIEYGADIDRTNLSGQSALTLARASENKEIIRFVETYSKVSDFIDTRGY